MREVQALKGIEIASGALQDVDINISPKTSSVSGPGIAETKPSISNPGVPAPHRAHDYPYNAKRSDPFQFGQRYLEADDDVFEYNAWDHVTPDEAHYAYCAEQYEKQKSNPVSDFDKTRFNKHPEKWWDLFYKQKTSTFFKDRKWLQQEFPILSQITKADAGKKVVLEVGAGAGNTAFPILRENQNPYIMIHAYDFSKKAVETMRSSPDYDENHMRAEVWDVASALETENMDLPPGLEEGSVDIVIMIFVFSALSPEQWAGAIRNIFRVLKPGGEVLFRDYGRGDLAQVRFKAGRWLGENFYVRGDGTRVYFFEKEELRRIWTTPPIDLTTKSALSDRGASSHKSNSGEVNVSHEPSLFEIINLDIDRRLIVNRQRRMKMFRCWLQGHFRKPFTSDENT